MMMDPIKIAALRNEYKSRKLDVQHVSPDPFIQFGKWFQDAYEAINSEINAMTLATVSSDGKPSARIVLLKGFDQSGFVFYTNYNSRKGQELISNPNAALVFYWPELERQIRIEGVVFKVDSETSKAYFQSRPFGSQVGAHASPQSQVIESRKVLEDKIRELEKKYKGSEVLPRPDQWGGFCLEPNLIEFWQGRPNRLHDRIRYKLEKNKSWKIERLAP